MCLALKIAFFTLIVGSQAALSFRSTGLATAYKNRASISPPGLDTRRLRFALADVGLDVSRERAVQLVQEHGEGGRLRLRHFSKLIRTDRSAEGQQARFWLTLDRDGSNGLRLSRKGFARFGYAGTLTSTRLAHAAIGGLSLIVGTGDMIQFIAARGIPHMPVEVAVQHGMLHTLVALLALPRFSYRYDDDRPWRLWMQTVPDAGMWPSFLQFAFYTAAMKSDMVLPPAEAAFSMMSPGFLGLTHTVSFFTMYQVLRAVEDDVEKSDKGWVETMTMLLLMTIVVYADLSRAIFFSFSQGAYDAYIHFITQMGPDFQDLQIATFLGAMYIGNTACALQSATHHKAVTDDQVRALAYFQNFVYVVFAVYACVFLIGDGQFVPAFLDAILWYR